MKTILRDKGVYGNIGFESYMCSSSKDGHVLSATNLWHVIIFSIEIFDIWMSFLQSKFIDVKIESDVLLVFLTMYIELNIAIKANRLT